MTLVDEITSISQIGSQTQNTAFSFRVSYRGGSTIRVTSSRTITTPTYSDSTTTPSALESSVASNGLQALYLFEDNLNDASGNNRNGVAVGSSAIVANYGVGKFGKALRGNQRWKTPSLGINGQTGDFSIACWAYGAGTQIRLFSGSTGSNDPEIQLYKLGNVYQSVLRFRDNQYVQNISLTNDAWNYLVWVKDDDTITLYVNGTSAHSQEDDSGSSFDTDLDFAIGSDSDDSLGDINVDSLRFYNRALTTTEITTLRNFTPSEGFDTRTVTVTPTQAGSHTLTIQLIDSDGTTVLDTETRTVSVSAADTTAPTITLSPTSAVVTRDAASGTDRVTVRATANEAVSNWRLSRTNPYTDVSAAIHRNTGVITISSTANVARSGQTVTVQCTDSAGNHGSKTLAISVVPFTVDTTEPTLTADPTSISITRDAASGTDRGTSTITADETVSNWRVSSISHNDVSSAISTSGVLTISSTANTARSGSVTVSADDAQGNTGTVDVSYSITAFTVDTTEPTLSAPSTTLTVARDGATGTDSATLQISADETVDSWRISEAVPYTNVFASINQSGLLTVDSSANVDQSGTSIRVSADDAQDNTGTIDIAIEVVRFVPNSAPTISSMTLNGDAIGHNDGTNRVDLPIGQEHVFVGTITDANAGDTFTAVQVGLGRVSDWATTSTLTVDQDANTFTFRWTPSSNALVTPPELSVIFRVNDGQAFSNFYNCQVRVIADTTAPTVKASPTSVTITRDAVSGTDTGTTQLSADEDVTWSKGSDPYTDVSATISNTGLLTLSSTANVARSGQTITVTATDGASNSTDIDIPVTVVAFVPDTTAPSLTATPATITITRDVVSGTRAGTSTITANEDVSNWRVSAISHRDVSSGITQAGVLTITSTGNVARTGNVTVSADDGSGNTGTVQISYSVVAFVPDTTAPTITANPTSVRIVRDAVTGTDTGTSQLTANETVTWSKGSNPYTDVSATISASGLLTLSSTANIARTGESITVTATDASMNSTDLDIPVSVVAFVPDTTAPTLTADPTSITIDRDATTGTDTGTTTITADETVDNWTVSDISHNDVSAAVVNGVLTISSTANIARSGTVTVTADDAADNTGSINIAYTVLVHPLAPSITSTHNNVSQWSKDRVYSATVTYTDPNTVDEDTTVSVTSSLTATLSVDTTGTKKSRTITILPTVTGDHTITITAFNSRKNTITDTATFVLHVDDIVPGPYTFTSLASTDVEGATITQTPNTLTFPNNPDESYDFTLEHVDDSSGTNVIATPTGVTASVNQTTGVVTFVSTAAGTYYVRASRVNDQVATLKSSVILTYTITELNVRPSISAMTLNGVAIGNADTTNIVDLPTLQEHVFVGTISDSNAGDTFLAMQIGLGRVPDWSTTSTISVDQDNNTFTFRWTPSTAGFNAVRTSPGLQVNFRVNDGTVNSTVYSCRIRLVENQPPTLAFAWDDGSSNMVEAGNTISGSFTSTDPDDDAITLAINPNNVDGVTFTDNDDGTADFEWAVPEERTTNQAFTVTATSLGGTATHMLSIMVEPARPRSPVLTSVHSDVAKFSKDRTYSLTVTYTDANTPDEDTTLTVVSNKAATITGSGSTGTDLSRDITITPTVTGTHEITITLSNTDDNRVPDVVEMFEIEVVDIVAGPYSFEQLTHSVTVDNEIELTPETLTFPNNPDETYTFAYEFVQSDGTAVPDGHNHGTRNPTISNAGVLTWTPSLLGTYYLKLTRTNTMVSSLTSDVILTINVVSNRPPTITADDSRLTVTAGQTANNTYMFADPEGDALPVPTVNVGTLTGVTFTPASNNASATLAWVVPVDTPAGNYNIVVNSGDSSHTLIVTVVNTAPTITPSAATTSIVALQQGTVSFTITDAEGSSITSIDASHDTLTKGTDFMFVAGMDNESGTLTYTPTQAQVGTQTFEISVVSAGVTTTLEYDITVTANTPPTVAFSGNLSQSVNAGDMVSGTFTVTPTNGDLITDLSISPNNLGTFTPNGTNTSATFSWTIPSTTETGTQDFVVTATDVAGSSMVTLALTITNRIPVITSNPPSPLTRSVGQAVNVRFTPVDPEGNPITLLTVANSTITDFDDYVTVESNKSFATLSFTAATRDIGVHTINVNASAIGGSATQLVFTLTIVANRSPQINSLTVGKPTSNSHTHSDGNTIYAGDSIQVRVNAVDADNDPITYSVSPNLGSFSGNRWTWTPTTELGDTEFTFTATSLGGTDSEMVTLTVLRDRPTITAVTGGQMSYEINEAGTYTITINNNNGPIRYSLSGSPSLASKATVRVNNNVITYTPTVQEDDQDLIFRATNTDTSLFHTFTIEGIVVLGIPTLSLSSVLIRGSPSTAIPTISLTGSNLQGQSPTYAIVSTDIPSNQYTLNAMTGKFNANITTIGTYTVNFKVTIGGLDSTTVSATIYVYEGPAFSPIQNYTIDAGSTLQFTVMTTRDEGLTITYFNDQAGTLDETTGVYTWIPSNSDVGDHMVEFYTQNQYGYESDRQTITITVTAVVLPELASITDKTALLNKVLIVPLMGSDASSDPPPFRYASSITSGPNTTDPLYVHGVGHDWRLKFTPSIIGTYTISVQIFAGTKMGNTVTFTVSVTRELERLQSIGVFINGIRHNCISCKIDDSFEKSIPAAEIELPANVNVQHNDDVKVIFDPVFKERNLNNDSIGEVVKKLPFSDYGTATIDSESNIVITYDTQLVSETEVVSDGLQLFLGFENTINPPSNSTYTLHETRSNPKYVVGRYDRGFVGQATELRNFIIYRANTPSRIFSICFWVRGRFTISLNSDEGRRLFRLFSSSNQNTLTIDADSNNTVINNYDRTTQHFVVCTVNNLDVNVYVDNSSTPTNVTLNARTDALRDIVITKYDDENGYLDSFRAYHKVLSSTERNSQFTYDKDIAQRVSNEAGYVTLYNGYGLTKAPFDNNLALDMNFGVNGPNVLSDRNLQVLDLSGLAQYLYDVDFRAYGSINETHMIFYEFDLSDDFVIGVLVNEPTSRKTFVTGTISTVIHCRRVNDSSTNFKIDIKDTSDGILFEITVGSTVKTITYKRDIEKIIIHRSGNSFNVYMIDIDGIEYSESFTVSANTDYSGICTINADYFDLFRILVYETSRKYIEISNELKPTSILEGDVIQRFTDSKILVDDKLKCFLPMNGDISDHTDSGNDGVRIEHAGIHFPKGQTRFGVALGGDSS